MASLATQYMLSRIMSALAAVKLATSHWNVLAPLDPKALHLGSRAARRLLVPLLERRSASSGPKNAALARGIAVHGDGAARPEHAAKGKGVDTLGGDVGADGVAVVVAELALVVAFGAFEVFAGPNGETPGVGTEGSGRDNCEERCNLHDSGNV